MLIIVSVVSAAPTKSSSTPSSAACHGMACAAFARLSSPSCSPTLTRNTSLLMRLTKTTHRLLTGRRQHRQVKTSTRRACHSLDTHISGSTPSAARRRNGSHTHIIRVQILHVLVSSLHTPVFPWRTDATGAQSYQAISIMFLGYVLSSSCLLNIFLSKPKRM